MSKVDIQVGNSDIPISIYSAVEKETSFKQFSNCCKSSVKYKKVCDECLKELESDDIFKGLGVGDEIKPIDTDMIKTENGNLNILGKIEVDIENNVFYNGDVWFVGLQVDRKNKAKTQRNLMKFSYFKESLKSSNKAFLGLVSLRGKEKIVVLKPYMNCLVGLGVYHFDRIRDVKELTGYNEVFETDKEVIKQMSEKINEKDNILLKDIENKREEMISNSLDKVKVKNKKLELENPLELVNF